MLGVFWKIQEICNKMGTRILKIDLEMTEINDPKFGNPLLIESKSAIKMILLKSSLSHVFLCNVGRKVRGVLEFSSPRLLKNDKILICTSS